jgi:hypothetical protein
MKLHWTKDTNGLVSHQPPCPKRGHPALDQRGFWSAQSQTGQRFVIEPVYSNSPSKAWFHIVCYTLSNFDSSDPERHAEDQIYFEGRTVKECKDHAQTVLTK